MAFYMGLSNRYGGKYQISNMDESNWYESIHSSYSNQNSVRNSSNIVTSMTVPVSPIFSSHTVRDSEPEFSQSSATSQRPVYASTTESLYLPGQMLTTAPIESSAKTHARIFTPSSTLIPRTEQVHRPLYSLKHGHVTEPVNSANQIHNSTPEETPSPVHMNGKECISNNNQAYNFFSRNKPVSSENKASIIDTHQVFSSIKNSISANKDLTIDDIGHEVEESIANRSKKCSMYTPINYSMAKPLDGSKAMNKEGQKKSKKQRFLDETPEQKVERLKRLRMLALFRRSNETPEQKEERLERSKMLALFKRSNETPEQRAHRLMVGRDRMKILRDNETEAEKAKRLENGKMLQHQRRIRERLIETKEERKIRLREARDRSRQRRAEETSEQREERLRVTNERLRLKRQNESPETKARRLKTVCENKRKKYHQMSHEDKVMMRIEQQEKKLKKTNESDSDNKRKTRGKDVKYGSTFEDDYEDALLQLHGGQFQYYNIPLTRPDPQSQRITNPVDFVVKKELEDPQSEYCQEDTDTYQDVKPVVSDLDRVNSGASNHGNT